MTAHGTGDEVVVVTPDVWVGSLAAARDEGFSFLDFLDCTDEIGRAEQLRIVARVVDWTAGRARQLHVRVDRSAPVLDSAVEVFAGAAWHEREVRDFFGVEFQGGDDAALLNHSEVRWLRKDAVLAARAAQPWPGGKEPGEGPGAARRRMAPPGVPDPAVWGERDPAAEPATPQEVAAAVAGGRVRRRR